MARLVSEGRRREFAAFGWKPEQIPDPEDRATFERSKLDWSEVNRGEHAEMLAWYRALIALRHREACLRESEPGNTRVEFSESERWLRMRRGAIEVVCNLGGVERLFRLSADCAVLLASREGIAIRKDAVVLPPETVVILRHPVKG